MSQHLQNMEVGELIEVKGPVGRLQYHGLGRLSIQREDTVVLFAAAASLLGESDTRVWYCIAAHTDAVSCRFMFPFLFVCLL